MEELDDGRVSDAESALREAKDVLAASPAAQSGAAAEMVRAQEERLSNYQSVLRNESARAKKAIQYDNYRKQKNK